jgi:hypothetical protein
VEVEGQHGCFKLWGLELIALAIRVSEGTLNCGLVYDSVGRVFGDKKAF